MAFTLLPLGAAPDVLATITKTRVVLALSGIAVRRLGWSEDEPNVAVALGDGADAGWLRIALDEDGVTPETADGRVYLTVPRSTLPDLTECRASPLTWRAADGPGIDVRLPTTVARGRPTARLVATDGRRLPPDEPSIEVIAPPDLYQGLHQAAWANGIELMFLADGTVSVNGRIHPADDVEGIVRAAVERRNGDRQRAGA